jgi:hypothetical protein
MLFIPGDEHRWNSVVDGNVLQLRLWHRRHPFVMPPIDLMVVRGKDGKWLWRVYCEGEVSRGFADTKLAAQLDCLAAARRVT